jgi:RNA polymerase sigma-70 factor (ECF subfamily)
MARDPSLIARYPTVDPAAFAAHLDAVLPPDVATDLVDDLALAFAAAHGDPTAVHAFERDVLPAAAAALRVVGTGTDTLDECVQRVRVVLLLGRDDQRPRLLDYRARGKLRGWVRVIAIRENLMLHRGRREIALDDAVLASVPDPADDPELRYLHDDLRDALRDAVASALAILSSRDRALLRYSLIDGLTLDEIGAIYGAHKSTVSRWLARAREQLWERAREQLAAALGGQFEAISSLVRGLRTGLDLSLERLLGDQP